MRYLRRLRRQEREQIMINDYKQITITLTEDEIEILRTIDSETATVEGATLTGIIDQILAEIALRESK